MVFFISCLFDNLDHSSKIFLQFVENRCGTKQAMAGGLVLNAIRYMQSFYFATMLITNMFVDGYKLVVLSSDFKLITLLVSNSKTLVWKRAFICCCVKVFDIVAYCWFLLSIQKSWPQSQVTITTRICFGFGSP